MSDYIIRNIDLDNIVIRSLVPNVVRNDVVGDNNCNHEYVTITAYPKSISYIDPVITEDTEYVQHLICFKCDRTEIREINVVKQIINKDAIKESALNHSLAQNSRRQ